MTHRLSACLCALTLAITAPLPAAAQDSTLPEEAERLMDEGMSSLMQALGLLLKTVPQYSAPEVQPNGDIIIRRLNPADEAPEEDLPADDEDLGDSTET